MKTALILVCGSFIALCGAGCGSSVEPTLMPSSQAVTPAPQPQQTPVIPDNAKNVPRPY